MPRKPKEPQGSKDTTMEPWVSNYPPLKAWLDKHEARCQWQLPSNPRPNDAAWDWSPGSYIEGWRLKGSNAVVILVVHSNKMGWDVFTSVGTNNVGDTLEDAEKRLGLK